MAKRRRLIPTPHLSEAASDPQATSAGAVAGENKSFLRPGLGAQAPIAQVAGEASVQAALAEMSDALSAARREGRLVLRMPLDQIDMDHLVRDRIGVQEDELQALIASIESHGQRTPIEVTELAAGRFGLISGWRRVQALQRLWQKTGDSRFAEVLVLLRRPETAQDAYVAMVEENEIRLGLSYYERARIAARSVEAGVFTSERQALQCLFATATRPRRSKIGSFMSIYAQFDQALKFPAAIPERLGLAIAKAIQTRPVDVLALRLDLLSKPVADQADEQNRLIRFAKGHGRGPAPVALQREPQPGVFLNVSGRAANPVLTLSGPAVTVEFREKLERWLANPQ